MPDSSATEIAVGDQVRVHYHPPGQTKSFVEGVVTRVEVATEVGRMFVVAVTSDIIYDREQPFRPGYKDYILYEPRRDFSGRIEVMPQVEKEFEAEPEHVAGPPSDPQLAMEPATGRQPEQETAPEPEKGDEETRGLGRMLGAVFGRRA
ncbi:hypothetical protein ACFOYU_04850 [Microvirga sp. GCM10011540]|uniref:hypothetical protein n=1 Tax=Microvirga sp. GCM10011540 TaxID=3317338 RepID=UPI0036233486